VSGYADAVVVGSAIVGEMERLEGEPDLVTRIGSFLDRITGFS
jgi:tryptophan synthase alpha subunit